MKLTIDQIAVALMKNNGMIALTAKELNVTVSCIWKRVQRSRKLQLIRDDVQTLVGDVAESVLMNRLQANNLPNQQWDATKLWFKYKGHTRGYFEKTQLAGDADAPLIPVQLVPFDKLNKKKEIKEDAEATTEATNEGHGEDETPEDSGSGI